jgi:hypothetical protein
MVEVMQRLQAWYASRCDGAWEHQYGVRITTLDNPGWSVRIDVRDTGLEIDDFVAVCVARSAEDWLVCEIKAGVYEGVGGADNLAEIVEVFLRWAKV